MNPRKIVASVCFSVGLAVIAASSFAVRPETGFFGLTPEAAQATKEFVASLPPTQIVGVGSDEDNQRQRVVLDGLLLKHNNGQWPFHGPQETGDCSAFAWAAGIEVDQASQIESGEPIEFHPVNRQWQYSAGRWQNGRKIVSGEGSIPSLQAEFNGEHGVLFQTDQGAEPYSGSSSIKWGNMPPPVGKFPQTKEHLVTAIAPVRSAQEACNFLVGAKAPIVFGSMRWGTSNNAIKLVEGRNLARDTTDWPHAQVCTGFDGTVNGQRMFRILNSWGENQHKPQSTMPGDRPGGYYVTWETFDSICREGMAFAVSGTQGFRVRRFVPDWSVIGAASADSAEAKVSVMSDPWVDSSGLHRDAQVPGFLLGCVLMLAGAVMWFARGNRFGKLAAGAAVLTMLALTPNVQCQETATPIDWSALTIAASARPSNVLDRSALTAKADELLAASVVQVPDFSALTLAAVTPPVVPQECQCGCAARYNDLIQSAMAQSLATAKQIDELKRRVGELEAKLPIKEVAENRKPLPQLKTTSECQYPGGCTIHGFNTSGVPTSFSVPAGWNCSNGKCTKN